MANSDIRSAVLLALAAAAAGAAPGAGAQDTAAAEAEVVLEEVIVTAERREMDLQRTSIAMTVVSGEQITAAGVTDLRGIEAVAPDLNVRTDTLFTHFTVRGVGSFNNNELADPGVVIALDNEFFNRPVALNASMMDLERVEVLRGPQGTLYGRNATAGVVNLVTRKPTTDEFGGDISVEAGNYSSIIVQGAANIPLSDSFAIRVAGQKVDRDGYLDNGPGGDGDDADNTSARITMQYTPTDELSILLAADYVDVYQSSTVQYGVNVTQPPYSLPAGSTPANIDIPVPEDGWPLSNVGFFDSDQYGFRWTVDYDFGGAGLTYLGAYRNTEVTAETPLNGFIPETFLFDNYFEVKTQSHELRLHGGNEDAFLWQAGLFYSDENQYVARGLFLRSPPLPPQFANGYVNYFLFPDIDSTTKAVFAQVTGHLTDELRWTVGGRYTQDDKERVGASFPRPGPPLFTQYRYPNPPTDVSQGVNLDLEDDWSKFTWLANLEWQWTPENMLYGKISTGYKAGGFDNVSVFDPENVTAYEIGSKNRFMDDRLQLNGAVFFYDYEDQQVSVFIDSTVGAQIVNAGSSEVFGIEAEVLFALTERGRLRATVNYLDAEFKELLATEPRVNSAPSNANPQLVDLEGNTPIQSPEWTITAGYDHTWDFSGGASLTGSISTRYKSEYYTTVFNWVSDTQESMTNTDASLTFKSASDSWELAAFVRNIEDERPLGFSSFTGTNINIYNFIWGGAPRTYGGRFTYRF